VSSGVSNAFNYWASPDANIPRAHTDGFGPNASGLTGSLPARFFHGENEYVRSLADEGYIEEEEREGTSRGNDVAHTRLQESRGISERLRPGSRAGSEQPEALLTLMRKETTIVRK
jgi:hypothetical protein